MEERLKYRLEDYFKKSSNTQHSDLICLLPKFLSGGLANHAYTGCTGSDKAALLKAIIGSIDPRTTILVDEAINEMNLFEIYPERNICPVRGNLTIDPRDEYIFVSKAVGASIYSEVDSDEAVEHMLKYNAYCASFILFIHCAQAAEEIVAYLRDAIMRGGVFNTLHRAERLAVYAVQADVHLDIDERGAWFISRITEVIPKTPIGDADWCFETRDILLWDGDAYRITGRFSEETEHQMLRQMDKETVEGYRALFG